MKFCPDHLGNSVTAGWDFAIALTEKGDCEFGGYGIVLCWCRIEKFGQLLPAS